MVHSFVNDTWKKSNENEFNKTFKEGGRFREFEYCYNGIVWTIVLDPYKGIDIGEWLMCGGGWLERLCPI